MQFREIEPGLAVYECPQTGGLWIPLQSYLAWKDRQPPGAAVPSGVRPTALQDDSGQPTLICPESGRLLLRYRVGHGLPFHVDRSPATGGVWLDKGEWEALKSKGLHVSLHLIFTAAYQRAVRSSEYVERMMDTFRERIGAADFAKVTEFAAWVARHPRSRDICCYLLDDLQQRTEPTAAPNGGPTTPLGDSGVSDGPPSVGKLR
jgi:Zn-finger nucleic acid-binding protein